MSAKFYVKNFIMKVFGLKLGVLLSEIDFHKHNNIITVSYTIHYNCGLIRCLHIPHPYLLKFIPVPTHGTMVA
jgi:hypothetical protein